MVETTARLGRRKPSYAQARQVGIRHIHRCTIRRNMVWHATPDVRRTSAHVLYPHRAAETWHELACRRRLSYVQPRRLRIFDVFKLCVLRRTRAILCFQGAIIIAIPVHMSTAVRYTPGSSAYKSLPRKVMLGTLAGGYVGHRSCRDRTSGLQCV